MELKHFYSGGIIVNYHCSSTCGHCLYRSSKYREKDYMDSTTLGSIIEFLNYANINSVHIGGGEPFLHPDKLIRVVRQLKENNIYVEYIETNSSFCNDSNIVKQILRDLMNEGVDTLLISMSPFHNEYIPFYKVKNLIRICKEENMNIFPWIRDFYNEIDSFDDTKVHSLKEYSKKFGEDYILSLLNRYHLTIGGRVLDTYDSVVRKLPKAEILKEKYCNRLSNTSHFHVDLNGKYIPGLCTGLEIDIRDIMKNELDKYKLINELYDNGISGLYEMAKDKGFKAKDLYINSCDLCNDIRKFLFENESSYLEIGPKGYYMKEERHC